MHIGMKCHIVIETASTPSDSQDTFVFAAQRLRMPKAVWYSLSASDQQTWDTFSDETKRKILHAFANGEMSPGGNRNRDGPDPHASTNGETSAGGNNDRHGPDPHSKSRPNSSRKAFLTDLIIHIATIRDLDVDEDKESVSHTNKAVDIDNNAATTFTDVITAAVHEGKFNDISPAHSAKMMSGSYAAGSNCTSNS